MLDCFNPDKPASPEMERIVRNALADAKIEALRELAAEIERRIAELERSKGLPATGDRG